MTNPAGVQHLRALEHAHRVRSARAVLKRQLKAQNVNAVALMRGDDTEWEPWILDVRIDKFLSWVHGFGEATVDDAVEVLNLNRRLTIAGLSFELRGKIADLIYSVLSGIPMPPPPVPEDRHV